MTPVVILNLIASRLRLRRPSQLPKASSRADLEPTTPDHTEIIRAALVGLLVLAFALAVWLVGRD